MESMSSSPSLSVWDFVMILLLRPILAIGFVLSIISLGWLAAWKLVLVHVPLVLEIFGLKKKPVRSKPHLVASPKFRTPLMRKIHLPLPHEKIIYLTVKRYDGESKHGKSRTGTESLIEINEETPSSMQHALKILEIHIIHLGQ